MHAGDRNTNVTVSRQRSEISHIFSESSAMKIKKQKVPFLRKLETDSICVYHKRSRRPLLILLVLSAFCRITHETRSVTAQQHQPIYHVGKQCRLNRIGQHPLKSRQLLIGEDIAACSPRSLVGTIFALLRIIPWLTAV